MLHPKDRKLTTIVGLLQPSSHGAFKLVSSDTTYFLKVPDSMATLLNRHLWETFSVSGELIGDHVIAVRRAKTHEENIQDGFAEIDSMQDMELYTQQIHHGFNLEFRGLEAS